MKIWKEDANNNFTVKYANSESFVQMSSMQFCLCLFEHNRNPQNLFIYFIETFNIFLIFISIHIFGCLFNEG